MPHPLACLPACPMVVANLTAFVSIDWPQIVRLGAAARGLAPAESRWLAGAPNLPPSPPTLSRRSGIIELNHIFSLPLFATGRRPSLLVSARIRWLHCPRANSQSAANYCHPFVARLPPLCWCLLRVGPNSCLAALSGRETHVRAKQLARVATHFHRKCRDKD